MSDRINQNVPIHEIPCPQNVNVLAPGARAFRMNGCNIIVSDDPGEGWHLSISRPDRDPSWGEIVTARYRLLADVSDMAMYLPSLDEYVNTHPHTFHLHEVKRSSLLALT